MLIHMRRGNWSSLVLYTHRPRLMDDISRFFGTHHRRVEWVSQQTGKAHSETMKLWNCTLKSMHDEPKRHSCGLMRSCKWLTFKNITITSLTPYGTKEDFCKRSGVKSVSDWKRIVSQTSWKPTTQRSNNESLQLKSISLYDTVTPIDTKM